MNIFFKLSTVFFISVLITSYGKILYASDDSDLKSKTLNEEWKVSQNGKVLGTFSVEDIRYKRQIGQFTDTAFVWKKGMAKWVQINTVEELKFTNKTVTPGTKWKVAVNEKIVGEFTAEQIIQKRQSNEFSDSFFVWKRGMEKWLPINSVKEFSFVEESKTEKQSLLAELWYLERDGENLGKFSTDEVQQMINNNEITDKCHIWKKGFKDWQLIIDVEAFQFSTVETATGPPPASQILNKEPSKSKPCTQKLTMCKQQALKNGAPVTSATGGVGLGFALFLGGFGTFMASMIPMNVECDSPMEVGLWMIRGGASIAAVGDLISTIAMTSRHNDYINAGYEARGKKNAAWTLTVLGLALSGGAYPVWAVQANDPDQTIEAPDIVALVMSSTGMILHIINTLGVKRKWNEQLIRSAGGDSSTLDTSSLKPVVYPLIATAKSNLSNTHYALFGVGLLF